MPGAHYSSLGPAQIDGDLDALLLDPRQQRCYRLLSTMQWPSDQLIVRPSSPTTALTGRQPGTTCDAVEQTRK